MGDGMDKIKPPAKNVEVSSTWFEDLSAEETVNEEELEVIPSSWTWETGELSYLAIQKSQKEELACGKEDFCVAHTDNQVSFWQSVVYMGSAPQEVDKV